MISSMVLGAQRFEPSAEPLLLQKRVTAAREQEERPTTEEVLGKLF